jgi:chromosomal replication initiation ATPase DnaA
MNTFDKQELIKQINKHYNTDVQSTARYLDIVTAKKALCYYMRIVKKCTFQETANLLNLNHATVIHHVEKHNNLYKYDSEYRNKYIEFEKYIQPIGKRYLCRETNYLPKFK